MASVPLLRRDAAQSSPEDVRLADMTHESFKPDVPAASSLSRAVSLPVVAWLVQQPGGESWVTNTDPERYRSLGYQITPLVREPDARSAVTEATEKEARLAAMKHADDLIALAQVVRRLRTIIQNNYEYDHGKIRDDLMKWGFVEPHGGAGLVPTREGRRLDQVLELEWLRTKARWGVR